MVASGRGRSGTATASACFNPLHCGAVVASSVRTLCVATQGGRVSIPFIAGQWSLLVDADPTDPNPRCFNPLHCGAVVASDPGSGSDRTRGGVSIPFIAGQWSLRLALLIAGTGFGSFQSPSLRGSGRFRLRDLESRLLAEFQSPSLRGSGRFTRVYHQVHVLPPCFNPLHCGAVVASRRVPNRDRADRRVSIPFIAGQWSLL